jgi:DNA-binding CsgD family transcriptional regulator
MDAARPLDRAVLERGVQMRALVPDSARRDPPTATYLDWLNQIGALICTAPSLPTRMIIQDRAIAVLPARSDNTAAGAVVLTGQGTLTALCALFESIWATAQPWGQPPARDSRGLTAQQAEALRLLAAGHTDAAIAARLGVSARTARRIASELMTQLAARSRFEAGVRAAQRGWVPDQAGTSRGAAPQQASNTTPDWNPGRHGEDACQPGAQQAWPA